jgi:hypothetical protein
MRTPGRGWFCEEHQRYECVIPRKNNRGKCHGSLVADTDRCRMHLGKKAGPAIAEAKLNEMAAAELARLDVPPVSDPLAELARLAGQVVAFKDAMAARVNQLASLRYESAHGLEQLRAELGLWERGLDRCVATLTGMARLNIDARLVGVREKTADMLVQALATALNASGLDCDARWKVEDVFRKSIVLVRPLAENPECTQNEFVDGEIRSLEAKVTGHEYFPDG